MTDTDTSHYGRTMLILFWIGLMVVLVWAFSDYLDQRHRVESSDKGAYKEVVLGSSRGGHYIANGKINGQPVRFMVDTGATLVAIPANVARDLGLRSEGSGIAQTAGGTVRVGYTRLDQVRLGNIVLEDVPASINPDMTGIEEVLLGMSFLRELEITHRNNELRVRQYH